MAQVDEQTGMELVTHPTNEQVAEILLGLREVPEQDNTAVQQAIIARILAAETAEEAMAETPTFSTGDLVGVPFSVEGVSIARSRYGKDGKGGFLVCHCVNVETGEVFVLSTSAAKVAARILWFYNHDMLPQQFTVKQPVESASGFKVYDLEAP